MYDVVGSPCRAFSASVLRRRGIKKSQWPTHLVHPQYRLIIDFLGTPVASSQEAGLNADVATSSISSPRSSSQEAGSSGLTAAQAAAQAEVEALLRV